MERSNESVVAEWTKFYQDYFGLTVDLSSVKIPEQKEGFDRIIIVAKGLTYGSVIDAMEKNFLVYTYYDKLDENINKNDRWPNEVYAIRVRNRVEADAEFKNLSADDLARNGILGITCLERLLYELKYFAETGGHLDFNNWTLCAGSRTCGSSVVRVGWYSGYDHVCIDLYTVSFSRDGICSRLVLV